MRPSLVLSLLWVSAGTIFGAEQLPLMPWPTDVQRFDGMRTVTAPLSVSVSGAGAQDARVTAAVRRFYDRLSRQTGVPFLSTSAASSTEATLRVVVESKDHSGPQRVGDDESYGLHIGEDSLRLSASAPLGVLRGMETLLQLATPCGKGDSVCWPIVDIRDQPRFPWRGLSLDVSRHFIPVDGIKRTIDGLAAVKMNVLHWHLSDDEGFRVESKSYPKLHQLGSDGLYYTQAEVRDIVAYAREHGVRIVPEFDVPGHSTAWLVAYPTLAARPGPYTMAHGKDDPHGAIDPTKESTYKLLSGVVSEMAKLFPDEYFHIGGDELQAKEWNTQAHIRVFMKQHKYANTRQLHVYFNQRLQKIVANAGKKMMGWDEIREPGLPKKTLVQSWRGQKYLAEGAREGYTGILSAGYYLDLMRPASEHYIVDPLGGDAAELKPDERKLILGGEAAMWEELATAENIDAKLWPRTAAIAERLWSPVETVDLDSMYERLGAVSAWLEWSGLQHRSALRAMLTRLAAGGPVEPLAKFAALLEPVKNYERHRDGFSSLLPFNRLVDSISPESDDARRFARAVDAFLGARASALAPEVQARNQQDIRRTLADWAVRAEAVRPMLESSPMLAEIAPVRDAVAELCRQGLKALDSPQPLGKDDLDAITEAAKHRAHLLLPFAASIQRLAEGK